ncbi:helix-turn-helix transcriptional regulator [Streptomyces bacillaris]|uniref:helix-turn-helix transcriptional regulator n=1 Tax=Streptomyces bacillaris TaxID=68179 RepID=UPI00346165B1
MDYDFTFVVSGVTVDDDAAVDVLLEAHDALLARAGGVDLLSVTWSGDSAIEAALKATSAVQATVPQLRVRRLDRDLVGIHEIADRTGRSRQNVSQWVTGTRKANGKPFPAAEGTVGRSQAWLWSEVNCWLAEHDLDDGAMYPSRAEMTEIDFALANAIRLTFQSAKTPGFTEGRERVVEELHNKHIPGFLNFLSGLDGTIDELGQHVLIVADQHEPARDVMEFVSSFSHDVVLITSTDQFTATVLSTRRLTGPTKIVGVSEFASVGDWLRLVQNNPQAAFALESAGPIAEVAPIQRRLAIAA